MSEHSYPLVVLLLLIGCGLAASECPSECGCDENSTLRCLSCLEKYFRTYDDKANNCPCLPNFKEDEEHKELKLENNYCCPSNCAVCTVSGSCVSCPPRWEIAQSANNINVCVCSKNHYFSDGECKCLSVAQPWHYYSVEPEDGCYACPPGCICNKFGCIYCADNTSRVVVRVGNTVNKTCPCKSPYL